LYCPKGKEYLRRQQSTLVDNALSSGLARRGMQVPRSLGCLVLSHHHLSILVPQSDCGRRCELPSVSGRNTQWPVSGVFPFWESLLYLPRKTLMAWNFRKSLRFGPLRINLSKSGVGYSVGLPGVRLGRDAKGRKYQSLNIPGTGIYRRDYTSTQPNVPPRLTPTSWFAAPKLYVLGLALLIALWVIVKLLS
jgi:hypothetical protein